MIHATECLPLSCPGSHQELVPPGQRTPRLRRRGATWLWMLWQLKSKWASRTVPRQPAHGLRKAKRRFSGCVHFEGQPGQGSPYFDTEVCAEAHKTRFRNLSICNQSNSLRAEAESINRESTGLDMFCWFPTWVLGQASKWLATEDITHL